MQKSQSASVSGPLDEQVRAAIAQAGGWLPFDQFMAQVLYAPGLGYYANARRKFGLMPHSGSDFVTAPELSPLFGWALAAQVAQGLAASGTNEVYEFGAGSGALAEQVLDALADRGALPARYTIVDVSGELRARQAERLARFGDRVQWADAWPAHMRGVVLGNEVLDAMPVQLLVRREDETGWQERGVALAPDGALAWADVDSALAIPFAGPVLPGMVTEIHPQAEAFIRSLAERLEQGLALFIDYGFPEAEYYHPQRYRGTLMCHRLHLADDNPLVNLGEKDITAHVNFSGIALAAQDAGLEVWGYTSQARFLLNCGLAQRLESADLRARAMAQKLITEHEMGELFKVIALGAPGLSLAAHGGELLGFAQGDRTHRL